MTHLEPGAGQRQARRINRRVQSLLAHCVATANHWVPGDSGIPGQGEADRPANLAGDASGSTVLEQQFTLAANRARGISKRRWAAKAEWEADKCSKHFSYRLKDKAGTKRPIPMTSVTSLAATFYKLMSGLVPNRFNLQHFGHQYDDQCWRCGCPATQTLTQEHLFRHCSRWRDQQKAHLKSVGKAMGWKAG